ncbi:MAG: folate-binding protein YgfZ [Betaproteobacteria bacterium]|nr:folate-binding protein YgfZ [Betaproteobacteria bacterium]
MDRASTTFARLSAYGALAATGPDARAFLHAQLTNDVAALPVDCARIAGWCSAKGRLLASLLVVPHADAFVLQIARELAEPVAKRLAMFILRSKAKLSDASEEWHQYGLWGRGAAGQLSAFGLAVPAGPLAVAAAQDAFAVRVDEERFLIFARTAFSCAGREAPEPEWQLQEIRAGRPLVVQATQDQFVPQMMNFELIGGVDFRKGCYPGQEIVARAQYRGQVKRRMLRARVKAAPFPGQDLFADDGHAIGAVVNVAPSPEGDYELLAIAQTGSGSLHLGAPGGPVLERLTLPYAA